MDNRELSRPVLVAAIVAVAFGVLTVASGGFALFSGADMGAVVPLVLWFNFLAGFAYVAAGLGLWFKHRRVWWLCLLILVATLLVLLGFAAHVVQGGSYELRTAVALLLRSGTWAAITIVAYRARMKH
mgnify:CR=1 FL=1